MQALYHFTFVKRLIGILGEDRLVPGRNGHVCLTFRHDQRLFRYAPAVLVLDPGVATAFGMTRHIGDAAVLAGGDEFEYRTAKEIDPLSAHLLGIAVRPSVLKDDDADFRAQYGLGKREFLAMLRGCRERNIQVEMVDFNDTVLDWHGLFIDDTAEVLPDEEGYPGACLEVPHCPGP